MCVAPVAFLIAFCAVIGAVMWIAHHVDDRSIRSRHQYLEQGICVRGVVKRIDHVMAARPNYWEIIAQYEVDGIAFPVSSGKLPSKPPCEVGDRITVRYMPGDPNDSAILDIDISNLRL